MTINNFEVLNMNDLLDGEFNDILAEDIRNFVSRNNQDVENFLKKNAANFCRLKQGVTYLVYNRADQLVGYFTFALKIMEFKVDSVSKSTLRVLERLGQYEENKIKVPGILLAQWSKNFSLQSPIKGDELMNLVEIVFLQIQHLVGGSFCFLECEAEREGLLRKYGEYGYKPVSERVSKDGKTLVQLIKKI